jgi:hypothetical protein
MEAVNALARVLERGRKSFNARFAQAHAAGSIDAVAFADHLRDVVAPIVETVDRVRSDRVETVVNATYDLSLELLAGGLLGPQARHPAIVRGWRLVLPQVPWLVAEEPQGIIGSVTNALYNLSLHEGARPERWIDEMTALAAQLTDGASFRAAGHVVAWRCGMAQHRQSALASCGTLPIPVACRALGIEDSDEARLNTALDQLAADPWLTPAKAHAGAAPTALRLVSSVGAFRGFGGTFLNPPRLFTSAAGELIAADSERSWAIIADVFGSALLPLSMTPPAIEATSAFELKGDGTVRKGPMTERFEAFANAASQTSDGATLALTIGQSHEIFLIALQ